MSMAWMRMPALAFAVITRFWLALNRAADIKCDRAQERQK
jgi:hypothetical protein